MTETTGVYARRVEPIDRYVQVGIAQGRVLSVAFPTDPDPTASSDHDLLDRIEAVLDGERDEFSDVRVALTLPTPQRAVLEAVQTIPCGETVSVSQLARMVPGDPDESAVREALASNPAPVLIPTHRVRDGPTPAPAEVIRHLRRIEGV